MTYCKFTDEEIAILQTQLKDNALKAKHVLRERFRQSLKTLKAELKLTNKQVAEQAGLPTDKLTVGKVNNVFSLGFANPEITRALFKWIRANGR